MQEVFIPPEQSKYDKLYELFGELINDTVIVAPNPSHVWFHTGNDQYKRFPIVNDSDGIASPKHMSLTEYRIADVAENAEGERVVLLTDPNNLELMFYEVSVDEIYKAKSNKP